LLARSRSSSSRHEPSFGFGCTPRRSTKLIVSRKLAHGAYPVTRWVAAWRRTSPGVQDPADNLKPAKDKSTERIDGIVAIIMTLGRATLPQSPSPPTRSSSWAAGRDQGQAHLMTVTAGAVDAARSPASGIKAAYTPARG
jgi:hypothetical protein